MVGLYNPWQNIRQNVKKLKKNWTEPENSNNCSYIKFQRYFQNWFLEKGLNTFLSHNAIYAFSPNSIGFLWDNLYTKLIILNITFSFNCWESNLHGNIENYQNIMATIDFLFSVTWNWWLTVIFSCVKS